MALVLILGMNTQEQLQPIHDAVKTLGRPARFREIATQLAGQEIDILDSEIRDGLQMLVLSGVLVVKVDDLGDRTHRTWSLTNAS